ncbi:MAG: SigE family RNA polymerase sigma factor [Actinomycetota bacterium]|nr:SigE family RNA polymerase sigma factor [Actinomycetota bacterium]
MGDHSTRPSQSTATPTLARDPDVAVTALYSAHYAALVRLATMLLHDQGRAEEIVQDAFICVHGRWRRIKEPDKAVAYLRTTVLNRSRSELRHRKVVARHEPEPPGAAASAESHVLARVQRDQMLAALDGLSDRQREVLILRYYLDLSEADIAATLGISRGAVKSHSSRGIAALRTAWEH